MGINEANNDGDDKTIIKTKYPGEIVYRNTIFCRLVTTQILQALERFVFRQNDIIIATYPKAGNKLFADHKYIFIHSNF